MTREGGGRVWPGSKEGSGHCDQLLLLTGSILRC